MPEDHRTNVDEAHDEAPTGSATSSAVPEGFPSDPRFQKGCLGVPAALAMGAVGLLLLFWCVTVLPVLIEERGDASMMEGAVAAVLGLACTLASLPVLVASIVAVRSGVGGGPENRERVERLLALGRAPPFEIAALAATLSMVAMTVALTARIVHVSVGPKRGAGLTFGILYGVVVSPSTWIFPILGMIWLWMRIRRFYRERQYRLHQLEEP